MVSDAVRLLNLFPYQHDVSRTLSPTTIVLGHPLPDFNAMRIEFSQYAQVFDDSTPSNTIRSLTLGAIALNPTGNAQGDVSFLSLASGRCQWTSLPVTDAAISRVESLALQEGQPPLQDSGLVVEWGPDHLVDDWTWASS
jgi:hypothetical protein